MTKKTRRYLHRPSASGKRAGISDSFPDVILASASPRRRELLKKVVSRFRVVPSGVDEDCFRDRDPVIFALQAAAGKAKAVGEECPSSLIIAADTLVCLGKEIFGKPKNHCDARAMLRKLSGKRHRVVTAVALYRKDFGRMITGHETSFVTFKKLGRKTIEKIVGTSSDGLDKAGSYAIQESGDALVRCLEGDYDNVVGLPVRLVSRLFKDFIGADRPF